MYKDNIGALFAGFAAASFGWLGFVHIIFS